MKAVDFIYEDKSYTIAFDQYYNLSSKNSKTDLMAYHLWKYGCREGQDFIGILRRCKALNLGEFDQQKCLSKTDAKKDFFLEVDDLSGILYDTFSGGRGRSAKYYHESWLQSIAQRKFGKDGFAEKIHKREQRMIKERRKTMEAEEALTSLTNQIHRMSLKGRKSWGTYLYDEESLKSIRHKVMKELRSNMTLDLLMKKRGPASSKNGYETAAIHIPDVEKAEFAALIGRPDDSALKTLVKKGAWYSQQVECNVFFNTNNDDSSGICSSPITGKGKRNDIVGMYPDEELTVKFKPCDGTLSIKARVHYLG